MGPVGPAGPSGCGTYQALRVQDCPDLWYVGLIGPSRDLYGIIGISGLQDQWDLSRYIGRFGPVGVSKPCGDQDLSDLPERLDQWYCQYPVFRTIKVCRAGICAPVAPVAGCSRSTWAPVAPVKYNSRMAPGQPGSLSGPSDLWVRRVNIPYSSICPTGFEQTLQIIFSLPHISHLVAGSRSGGHTS